MIDIIKIEELVSSSNALNTSSPTYDFTDVNFLTSKVYNFRA